MSLVMTVNCEHTQARTSQDTHSTVSWHWPMTMAFWHIPKLLQLTLTYDSWPLTYSKNLYNYDRIICCYQWQSTVNTLKHLPGQPIHSFLTLTYEQILNFLTSHTILISIKNAPPWKVERTIDLFMNHSEKASDYSESGMHTCTAWPACTHNSMLCASTHIPFS